MKRFRCHPAVITILLTLVPSCSTSDHRNRTFAPSQVIDLGAAVTEDLPQRVWGKAAGPSSGFLTGPPGLLYA